MTSVWGKERAIVHRLPPVPSFVFRFLLSPFQQQKSTEKLNNKKESSQLGRLELKRWMDVNTFIRCRKAEYKLIDILIESHEKNKAGPFLLNTVWLEDVL